MKQRSNANKTRYFKKDYAPARLAKARKKSSKKATRALAQISQTDPKLTKNTRTNTRTSKAGSGKVSKQIKQVAKKTGKTLQKTATSIKNATKKMATNAKKATAAPRKNSANRRITHKRKSMTWREITLISQIGVSAVAIIFTFAFCAINDPVQRSEKELEKLADAYYIEYLYPSSLGSKLRQPETILKDYTKIGLPAVKLRQLLLYNDGKYASSIEAFSNPYYKCDTNQTYVRYYPIEPYGPRDYTVKYEPVCEKTGA